MLQAVKLEDQGINRQRRKTGVKVGLHWKWKFAGVALKCG